MGAAVVAGAKLSTCAVWRNHCTQNRDVPVVSSNMAFVPVALLPRSAMPCNAEVLVHDIASVIVPGVSDAGKPLVSGPIAPGCSLRDASSFIYTCRGAERKLDGRCGGMRSPGHR